MRASEVAEEKKRKRTTPGPTGGCSSGVPPKYHMVYTPPVGQPRRRPHFGEPSAISIVATAVAVHPCSVHSVALGGS
jgi:hypothetical protein